MMNDPLFDLLKQADSPPSAAADSPASLAAKVRTTVRKRTTRRRVVATAALLLCVAGGSVAMLNWDRRDVAVAPSPPVQKRQSTEQTEDDERIGEQIAALRAEADSLERIVRRTIALRKLDELREGELPEGSFVDPQFELRDLADRAAISLLARAERKLESDREEAVSAFKRTIELFPGTEWAVAAHDRLVRIEKGTM